MPRAAFIKGLPLTAQPRSCRFRRASGGEPRKIRRACLMRNLKLLLTSLLLFAATCFSQTANVNVKADAGAVDKRPFGKYLVEICTLSGPGPAIPEPERYRVVTCNRLP